MNARAARLALLPSSRRPTGKLLLGMVALLLVLWAVAGIRTMLQQSSDAQKHWPVLLLPLAAVFVIIPIAHTKNYPVDPTIVRH
ncbi:MAG: hypothetical protein QF375_06785 [Arenicellales bacterium]|nr:hypothetical protein [Arenicellales bacterium]MDP6854215.1 hypothetical protein [Arenicellales bacterium]